MPTRRRPLGAEYPPLRLLEPGTLQIWLRDFWAGSGRSELPLVYPFPVRAYRYAFMDKTGERGIWGSACTPQWFWETRGRRYTPHIRHCGTGQPTRWHWRAVHENCAQG